MLDDLLWREHDPDIPGLCSLIGCNNPATARCQECTQTRPFCQACVVSRHRNLPLHWIDVWNGNFFERKDLSELHFILHLGHRGEECPNATKGFKPADFVILHENGVHKCQVKYCQCAGRPPLRSQLIRAGFFPATLDRTETAFTLDVLDDFVLDFSLSKKTAHDYIRRLVHKTNGQFPDQVQVRQLFIYAKQSLTAARRRIDTETS